MVKANQYIEYLAPKCGEPIKKFGLGLLDGVDYLSAKVTMPLT